jgi:hypothetical protein
MPIIERYHIANDKMQQIGFSPLFDIQTGINDLFEYLEKRQIS